MGAYGLVCVTRGTYGSTGTLALAMRPRRRGSPHAPVALAGALLARCAAIASAQPTQRRPPRFLLSLPRLPTRLAGHRTLFELVTRLRSKAINNVSTLLGRSRLEAVQLSWLVIELACKCRLHAAFSSVVRMTQARTSSRAAMSTATRASPAVRRMLRGSCERGWRGVNWIQLSHV